MTRPYYEDQYGNDYGWCDNNVPEPEEPEDTVVAVCENCDEDIYDSDEMAVVEDHSYISRPRIAKICMKCWEANGWDKSEELLDMIGVWYWTGDAVDAVSIANSKALELRSRNKKLIGIAADMGIAAVKKG